MLPLSKILLGNDAGDEHGIDSVGKQPSNRQAIQDPQMILKLFFENIEKTSYENLTTFINVMLGGNYDFFTERQIQEVLEHFQQNEVIPVLTLINYIYDQITSDSNQVDEELRKLNDANHDVVVMISILLESSNIEALESDPHLKSQLLIVLRNLIKTGILEGEINESETIVNVLITLKPQLDALTQEYSKQYNNLYARRNYLDTMATAIKEVRDAVHRLIKLNSDQIPETITQEILLEILRQAEQPFISSEQEQPESNPKRTSLNGLEILKYLTEHTIEETASRLAQDYPDDERESRSQSIRSRIYGLMAYMREHLIGYARKRGLPINQITVGDYLADVLSLYRSSIIYNHALEYFLTIETSGLTAESNLESVIDYINSWKITSAKEA